MHIISFSRSFGGRFRQVASLMAMLGFVGSTRAAHVTGSAQEIGIQIQSPLGYLYDAVLLNGTPATIAAEAGRRARIYFIDPNDDLVTVELEGAGTLLITLDDATSPAPPLKYNQPSVSYVKGLAHLVITGANSTTNLSIASVGRANTFDPTGTFNIAQPISASNDPVKNGSALFAGHETTDYDGVADIASVTIAAVGLSQFGTLDLANVRFSSTAGVAGIAASDVAVTGAVTIGNITASNSGVPSLVFGSAEVVSIAGGNLLQVNAAPVRVDGVARLQFIAGTNSHGIELPAQTFAGQLQSIGLNPTPVFIGSASTVFTAGENNVHTLQVSGTADAQFRIADGTFPSWATLDPVTGVISGMPPTLADSPFNFVVEASHNDATVSKQFSLSVQLPPRPEIESPDETTAVAGKPFGFNIAASGTVTSFSAEQLPPGLTVDPASGVISGTIVEEGAYDVSVGATNLGGTASAALRILFYAKPRFAAEPQSAQANIGDALFLSASSSGELTPTYQWFKDGVAIDGATDSSLEFAALGTGDAGTYTVVLTNPAGTTVSSPAIVGIETADKVSGDGYEIDHDVAHPNGRHYDQVLLTGTSETITAEPEKITRTSFIDMNDDIVQVEFAGAGTLSLSLAGAGAPAAPVNYNQPKVSYMKGHATIVITGADETSNLSIFTIGRATAFDPTGGFNFLQAISDTNQPSNNGSSLFAGHETTNYDGVADIALVAISSRNGKFGGVRTSNTHYWASTGLTGLYAPGVTFQGPVFVGNIDAFDAATPVLRVGAVDDARVTGGDLKQDNGLPLQVSGLTKLTFTPGSDSSGRILPAQVNQGVLVDDGVDVTATIVENPAP